MSRHIKKNKKFEIAYGFDHHLGYFFQVYDIFAKEEDDLIIDESSLLTGMSNGDMLDLMKEYGADENHITLVALDLPF